jgi:hypothetical protein
MNQEMMHEDPDDFMFEDATEETADMVDADETNCGPRCS